MKPLRSLLLILILVVFSSCATNTNSLFSRNRPYRKIRVTDYQGYLVAEWIAEGHVWRSPSTGGYRFKAIERRTSPPDEQFITYPQGRKVVVTGPNIVVFPCSKPEWLLELDGF